jgi:hypothetical protein
VNHEAATWFISREDLSPVNDSDPPTKFGPGTRPTAAILPVLLVILNAFFVILNALLCHPERPSLSS